MTESRQHGITPLLIAIAVIFLTVFTLFIFPSWFDNVQHTATRGIAVSDVLGRGDTTGYARAYSPRTFTFPEDHGPHTDYRHEWWYYTGNLATATGRHFGYQLTFFRFALRPTLPKRDSAWATRQIMMAHFAISDVGDDRFYHAEKTSRVALGLAGATVRPFVVWIDDWSAQGTSDGMWPLHLHAVHDDMAIDLTVTPDKPAVLQGEKGLSRKSSEPGNASYYYSFTHLETHGTIQAGNHRYQVTGLSWLDREWGTSSLAADQAGWNWYALQLSDGSDIMAYQLRRKDGSVDPFSSGKIIDPDGTDRSLAARDFDIRALSHWRSPHTSILYPSRWRLSIPHESLELEIEPMLADQELHASVDYWEGAVMFQGIHEDRRVKGYGYVELTGYGESGTLPGVGK